jgi:hypothetical protein
LINLSRTPGGARANPAELSERFRRFRPLVLRQIDVLGPDVIVGLGTMSFIGPDLGFTGNKCAIAGHAKACKSRGRILVQANHPVQSTISQENYCNDVISVIRLLLKGSGPKRST